MRGGQPLSRGTLKSSHWQSQGTENLYRCTCQEIWQNPVKLEQRETNRLSSPSCCFGLGERSREIRRVIEKGMNGLCRARSRLKEQAGIAGMWNGWWSAWVWFFFFFTATNGPRSKSQTFFRNPCRLLCFPQPPPLHPPTPRQMQKWLV